MQKIKYSLIQTILGSLSGEFKLAAVCVCMGGGRHAALIWKQIYTVIQIKMDYQKCFFSFSFNDIAAI